MTIKVIFILSILKKKSFNIKLLIPGIVFLLILIPHISWLIQNDFITIVYAFNRTGMEEANFFNHFYNPLLFLMKQLGILIPVFIMLFTFIKLKNFKLKHFKKDKYFLLLINIFPILLIFLTSVISGAKIRTM